MNVSPAWRRSLPVLLIALAAVLLLYRNTAWAMVEIWYRSETFAHAFVVPPIALWLIWRQRAALALQTPRPAPVFLLPIAAMAFLWFLGDLVAVNAATQFALVALLVLVVPATLGWAVARSIAFPLGFLFFSVPFGEFMMPQLMAWTADFTILAVRASGIPVYREGLQFVIPSGSWSVVEACSGIRYLMASVMVGALFAYLNYRSLTRRWIFVGVSILLPLAANWIRAYMIVMLGHLSGNQLATGADHLVYGWVFFGIIMLLMFMIGARWSEPDAAPQDSLPLQQDRSAVETPWARSWGTALVLVLILASPHWAISGMRPVGEGAPVALGDPALAGSAWQRQEQPLTDWQATFENPSAEWRAAYALPGKAPVGVYVAYYRQQNYQRKLISSNNVLVKSEAEDWATVERGTTTTELGTKTLPVRTAEIRALAGSSATPGTRLALRQFYWVNGTLTASDWQAKLHGAFSQLRGRGDDAAVVVIYADKVDAALLDGFQRDNWAGLDHWLGQVAASQQEKKTSP